MDRRDLRPCDFKQAKLCAPLNARRVNAELAHGHFGLLSNILNPEASGNEKSCNAPKLEVGELPGDVVEAELAVLTKSVRHGEFHGFGSIGGAQRRLTTELRGRAR